MQIPNRIVRVTVGPPGGAGLTWDKLYMEFDIEKSISATPNKVEVKLYNLSQSSIGHIEKRGNILQVIAGEEIASSLCYADISARGVKTEVTAPNVVTTISAAEARRIYRDGAFSRSYPAGTTRSQIMTDLIAHVRCTRGYIDPTIPERTYPTATMWTGAVRDLLVNLWAPDGAIHWFDGQTLHVLAAGRGLPSGNAPLISASSGMHGSPTQTDKGGIEVTCNLLPTIRPGQPFALQARFIKGNFRSTNVKHSGASDGSRWETKISGVPWK